MKELKDFPECDGHIESILIGCRMVKVSFQTWNAKKWFLFTLMWKVCKNETLYLGIFQNTQSPK